MESDHQHEELCEQCETPIPPNSPFGICPRCCFGAVDRGTAHQNEEEISGIELGEVIGEGAFGMVYEGVQLDYSLRRVAVKVMRGSGFDAGHRARFLEEMQIIALLKHPHIAQLLASGQMKDERPYYAMEFIDGAKLDELDKPDHQRVLELMIQLTEAVSHAHQRGIVHRDLKPSNVLIEQESGEVKVIDFGIARILSGPLLVSHEVTVDHRLGTPLYMSPEQLEGDPQIDTLTDIYSLGLLIYELCLGKAVLAPVISAEQSWAEHARKLKLFSFPRLATRGYSRELDWIARKACAFERSERYQTAENLLSDLQALRDGKLVTAGQHDWFYRTRKLAKRYRIGLTILTLLLVLFASIAGMGVWMSIKERRANVEISESVEIAREAEKKSREAEQNARHDASDARLQEANLALNSGDFSEALKLLKNALDLWPENAEAQYAHDFLISTRAFPVKEKTIPIDFQIAEITPTPSGFLLKGHKGEEQQITCSTPPLNHPLEDVLIEDSGNGIMHFKSRKTGEALMSPLGYGTGREKACFSPNTASVLSTTAEGTVQVWEVAGLRPSAESHKLKGIPFTIHFERTTNDVWIVDSEDLTQYDMFYRKWEPDKPPGDRAPLPGDMGRIAKMNKQLTKREMLWRTPVGTGSSNTSAIKSAVAIIQLHVIEQFGDWSIEQFQIARDRDVRVYINDSGVIWVLNTFGIARRKLDANASVQQLALSADGTLAAIISDNTISTFSPQQKEFIKRWTPPFNCSRVSLLDGGNHLIAIGDDGKARIYDPKTGKQIGPIIPITGELGSTTGIELLPVPHRLEFLTRMDGDLQIKRWDALTGEQIGSGLVHQDGALWFNCSLDGKFLFSIDEADENPERAFLRIWSLRTGKEIVPALAHDAPLNSAVILDNGQRIATASEDGTVRRWTISK